MTTLNISMPKFRVCGKMLSLLDSVGLLTLRPRSCSTRLHYEERCCACVGE